MSRPLTRSGQWSRTTTGISQPAARLLSAIGLAPTLVAGTNPY